MVSAGDVVAVDFPGATGTKRRPAVIVSSDLYHRERPDLILGLLTTNLTAARSATDYLLQDWLHAGLHQPNVRRLGSLTARDWQGVRDALGRSLG